MTVRYAHYCGTSSPQVWRSRTTIVKKLHHNRAQQSLISFQQEKELFFAERRPAICTRKTACKQSLPTYLHGICLHTVKRDITNNQKAPCKHVSKMCGKPIVYLFILRRLHSKPCYQYASDKSGYSAADTPRPNTNPHP